MMWGVVLTACVAVHFFQVWGGHFVQGKIANSLHCLKERMFRTAKCIEPEYGGVALPLLVY